METDEKTIFVDDREPDKLVEDLKKWAKDENFEVVIKKVFLDNFDVLYVNGDRCIGWEIKRLSTGDQESSNQKGRSKSQVKRYLQDCDYPKYFWVIGNPREMKYTDRKAMQTLKTEFNLIGVPSDTIFSQYWAAFRIIRACQFYEGDKEVVFRVYCNPVIRDDSLLTKMVKQGYRIGDKTASSFGSNYKNFLDIFLTKEQHDALLDMIDFESLYKDVSNFARVSAGKRPQKAPLQAIMRLIDWFFGIDQDSPNTPQICAGNGGVTHTPASADSSPVAKPPARGKVEERDGKDLELEKMADEIAWALDKPSKNLDLVKAKTVKEIDEDLNKEMEDWESSLDETLDGVSILNTFESLNKKDDDEDELKDIYDWGKTI